MADRARRARESREDGRKSAQSEADLVFLDLEDATAPEKKEGARKMAVDALNGLDWGNKVRAVRVNDHTTRWAVDDMISVATRMDEPIADAVRATVDGHVVLDRRLAEKGHFPAVNVLASVSRLFSDVAQASHQAAARKVRGILSTHAEVVDLVRVGAYVKGASPEVDQALQLMPAVNTLLRQDVGLQQPASVRHQIFSY